MSSRVLIVEVASIGKGDGARAHPCRYIVLLRRGLLVKWVAQLLRTVAECGAVPTIVSVATPPSVLVPLDQSSGCPRRLVRGTARMTEPAPVEEVGTPSAAQLHRRAIKPGTTTIT